MSKKQSEHIVEEKIKEAAIKSEPPFEDYAWQKMEEKLNKESGKKKYIYAIATFFFLFGLFISVPKIIYVNNVSNKINIYSIQNDNSVDNNLNQYQHVSTNLVSENSLKQNKKLINNSDKNILSVLKNRLHKNEPNEKQASIFKQDYQTINRKIKSRYTNGYIDYAINADQQKYEVIKNNNFLLPLNLPVLYSHFVPENFILSKEILSNVAMEKKYTVKKTQKENEKKSRFYFLTSVGTDMSNVKLFSFKNNSAVFKYGIGVGFDINKKISLQTGFYSSRKKYIAGPQDYKIEKGSYWDMVQLTRVDAACLVYEIPITIRYNFLKKPSFNLYTSAGISSFIMKKEDYYYHYIRYNIPHESPWSYTGNKNLLSILNLNVGLEKKISPVFSFFAEPSISIPLAGVGEGKVKLFSTSFQAGLKYQPFKK